jgi:hypothetical protein
LIFIEVKNILYIFPKFGDTWHESLKGLLYSSATQGQWRKFAELTMTDRKKDLENGEYKKVNQSQ